MDSLRLTLVIIGLIIVVGIYFRFRSADEDLILWFKKIVNPITKNMGFESSKVPALNDDDFIPTLTPIDDEPNSSDFEALSQVISGRDHFEKYSKQEEISFTAVEDTNETGSESLLIVLNIMSPQGHVFTGEGIHAVMISAGLTHGEHNIYHYLQDNIAIFSIANAIEPGFFDISQLENVSTPGLAVFMELPGPIECRKAFNSLLEVSERLATALSGELCDENRSALTKQTISHLKDKVEAYRLKQQVSQRQKHQQA